MAKHACCVAVCRAVVFSVCSHEIYNVTAHKALPVDPHHLPAATWQYATVNWQLATGGAWPWPWPWAGLSCPMPSWLGSSRLALGNAIDGDGNTCQGH